jgi:hypothetical protein
MLKSAALYGTVCTNPLHRDTLPINGPLGGMQLAWSSWVVALSKYNIVSAFEIRNSYMPKQVIRVYYPQLPKLVCKLSAACLVAAEPRSKLLLVAPSICSAVNRKIMPSTFCLSQFERRTGRLKKHICMSGYVPYMCFSVKQNPKHSFSLLRLLELCFWCCLASCLIGRTGAIRGYPG